MMLIEFFAQVLVELIFEGIIFGFFKLIRKLGVLVLKVITLNKTSFKKLDKEYYKDSSKPYLIGFGILIGFVFLLL